MTFTVVGCDDCDGLGLVPEIGEDGERYWVGCPRCFGSGEVEQWRQATSPES